MTIRICSLTLLLSSSIKVIFVLIVYFVGIRALFEETSKQRMN
ncbi:hypothetical protein SAMD00020551_4142 [Mesobacillus selenatarsenatis SF-1]|uniref:Uncharacterized protein n=1 Tax=Mesobacillus selenatarsenatis (strain DSM 18680 / JCM 14380 / FERM P-15431 / SF-1) TaxID=1321606 RepID=A0A0A8XCV5_MESS1|nr:hypothetical protein SAMD00020551_4142 [Mesobacillus selenatarsenatis SF-1]